MVSYLQVENVTKSFGERVLFENISFSVHKNEKTGFISKNGSGKTTLLNIINGLETADQGKVIFKSDLKVAYLRQESNFNPDLNVIEQVLENSQKFCDIISNYEKALLSGENKAIQDSINQMDASNAWDVERRMRKILTDLKITNFEQKVGEFSGGQKKKLALAEALIDEPEFLILDEPTNHLDLETIEWLEDFLSQSNSTLLMVTHDRYFLDRICNTIIELSENQTYTYQGNYSYFLEKRQERIQNFNMVAEKAKNLLRSETEWIRRMPKARTTKAKYRIDNYDKLKEIASQRINDQSVEMGLGNRRLGNKIIDIFNINKKYDDIVLLKDVSYKFSRFERIGIVGKNGVGKTSFLDIITGMVTPDSGRIEIGETIKIGYYRQENVFFDDNKRLIEVIKDKSEEIGFGDKTSLSPTQFLEHFLFPTSMHYNVVGKLSGGEKRRLYLMTILMENPNFLILDEPTNDLDIYTINVLEEFLLNFKGCYIIVSHDRFFMDKVTSSLFVFEGEGIVSSFIGSYSDFYEKVLVKQTEVQSPKEDKSERQKPKVIKEKKATFKERQEFALLQKEIEDIQKEINETELKLSGENQKPEDVRASADQLSKLLSLLDEKEFRWLELSEIVD